jgi:acyl CoA:acetate/3-ketoacid CoA transferase beta subunit
LKVVNTIITELAVIQVTGDGLVLDEIHPDTTVEDVLRLTAATLEVHDPVRRMRL